MSHTESVVHRLDAVFSSAREADRKVDDASYQGHIEIPAEATAAESRLVIVVSNFGRLVVVAVDNPGAWSQDEFAELLHPGDAERVYAALEDLGYTAVPEEPLWQPYDGNSPIQPSYPARPATWWTRFFDYL